MASQVLAEPNRNPRGLIIGKFMPLTTGHCALICWASQQCDLTVLLGSLSHEPIDGNLRFNWLRDTFPTRDFPNLRIIHAPEDVPQYPREHPQFWNIWRDLINRYVGKIDVVFSSEEYGETLAQVLGARHIGFDLPRKVVPISATQVRADVYGNWEFLPPSVRAFYAKRVLIFGPESTGKTTLAQQLATHYQTSFVEEWARILVARQDNRIEESDIPAIVCGQIEREEIAAQSCNRIVFCDTDVVTTTVYARHFYGRCAPWVQRLADERISRYHLILFCETDLPWQSDPQRDARHAEPAFRQYFRGLFETELLSRRLPFHVVSGIGSQRVEKAIEIIENWRRDW